MMLAVHRQPAAALCPLPPPPPSLLALAGAWIMTHGG
jgi:hypothetical protein